MGQYPERLHSDYVIRTGEFYYLGGTWPTPQYTASPALAKTYWRATEAAKAIEYVEERWPDIDTSGWEIAHHVVSVVSADDVVGVFDGE